MFNPSHEELLKNLGILPNQDEQLLESFAKQKKYSLAVWESGTNVSYKYLKEQSNIKG